MVNCSRCNCTVVYGNKYCKSCGLELPESVHERANVEYNEEMGGNETEKDPHIAPLEEAATEYSEEMTLCDGSGHTSVIDHDKAETVEKHSTSLLKITKTAMCKIQNNFKREDIKVILILLVTIIIFITSAILKNKIHAINETYGLDDRKYMTTDGEVVYFTDFFSDINSNSEVKGFPIYKILGNKTYKIFSDFAGDLNVEHNYLYYTNNVTPDNSGVFKIKTDGTGKQQLYKGTALYLKLRGNFLYYMTYNNTQLTGDLYKMKLDDSGETKISSDVLKYEVVGNYIYYSSLSQLGDVYKMDLNGKGKIKLCTIDGAITYIKDGYIYYQSLEDSDLYRGSSVVKGSEEDKQQEIFKYLYSNGSIYRVKLDGTDKKVILEKGYIQFSFHNNTIISYNYEGFYKLNLDGNNKIKILDKKINGQINILNDNLYYYSMQDRKIYKKSLKTNEEEVIEIKEN